MPHYAELHSSQTHIILALKPRPELVRLPWPRKGSAAPPTVFCDTYMLIIPVYITSRQSLKVDGRGCVVFIRWP